MRLLAALAAVLLLAPPALAAEQPLTLSEAVALARRNSLAVASSRQTLAASRSDRGVTMAQGLPTVSLTSSVNYNDLPGLANFPGFSSLTIFPANGLYAQNQVSGSWTVFDAFASHDALLISDKTIQGNELAVAIAEQDAMVDAATAYFGLLKDQAMLEMNAGAVKRAKDQLALGRLRYKQDLITRADLLQLESQLGNALNAYAQAQNNLGVSRLTLANAINAPVQDRTLVPDVSLPRFDPVTERDLPSMIALRPEVMQATLREESDRTRVSLQQKAGYPTVALTSSYSQRNFDPGQFSAAMQMSWNAFDGFKVRNQVQSAVSTAEASHIALEQARQRAMLDVRQATQAYATATAQVTNTKATVAQAREAYRLSVARYKLDLITQFALSDVEATLIQAEVNQLNAINDQRVARIKLARALGYDVGKLLIRRS